MEPEAPKNNRREGLEQYRLGYGLFSILSFVFIYAVMPPEDRNVGERIGYVWTGGVFIMFFPFLFAWLGKTDTPRRRFALFLATWVIIVGVITIGVYAA